MSLLQEIPTAFMPIEKQCCTLDQSIKLEELMIEQNSTFYHVPFWADADTIHHYEILNKSEFQAAIDMHRKVEPAYSADMHRKVEPAYSAFTATELGEILSWFNYGAYGFPMFMSYVHIGAHWTHGENRWDCAFQNARKFMNPDIHKPTEAQARAEMLIFLLENKHWDVAEINSKINA